MGLGLSSYTRFSAALQTGHEVDLSAYTLGHGETERTLIAAADRGAHVRVRLAGIVYDDPEGMLARHNQSEVAELAAHGVDAALVDGSALHLKAAVIDGHAFFDDCNWCNRRDILAETTTADDVQATEAALHGQVIAPRSDGLAFIKSDALREESEIVADAQDPIYLQTEALGPSLIANALSAAADHIAVQVLVKRSASLQEPRVAKLIEKMKAHGVQIRSTTANDKYCVTQGQAWIGSANASSGDVQMSDWGAPIDDAADIRQLRMRFQITWNRAWPL